MKNLFVLALTLIGLQTFADSGAGWVPADLNTDYAKAMELGLAEMAKSPVSCKNSTNGSSKIDRLLEPEVYIKIVSSDFPRWGNGKMSVYKQPNQPVLKIVVNYPNATPQYRKVITVVSNDTFEKIVSFELAHEYGSVPTQNVDTQLETKIETGPQWEWRTRVKCALISP